jgi:succinoglycan biosynthesis transport protein ExoP
MKAQMEARVAAIAKTPADSTTGPHPTSYADLQAMSPKMEVESQLKANRLEVENRQRSIHQLEAQIDSYQSRLNTTPMREQQLAGLTRDYEQSRKNYEQLLAKRDQSEMATNLEKRQEGEQFRVLDAANLPQKPSSPNRLKLNVIGLIVGLVLGIGSLAGSEAIDDRIYSKEEFEQVLTTPVLTEIPPLPTPYEEESVVRQRWVQSVIFSLMAFFALAGFATTYLFG